MKKLILSTILAFVGFSLMAQKPVVLKLNLEKNKVYKAKSTSVQKMQMVYGGQPFNMDITSSKVMSFKVLKHEGEVLDIEFCFDTIASKTVSPMMNKETNSAKPAGNDPLEKIMNKISANKIIAKISTSGKFVDFVTYQKFKDNVMYVLDSIPAAKRDEAKTIADMLLNESTVKSMIEPIFAYLPEAEVKAGANWETTYFTTTSGISMVILNTFNLKSIEKGVAIISGKSEIETLPNTDPNAKMSQDLKGVLTFDGTIDVVTGLASKNTTKGRIEGSTTVKNGGQEMKIPIIADSQSETFMFK